MSNKTLSSRGRQEAQSKRAGRFRGSSINLFYLPAVILLAVFIVYPLFSGIGLSLTNWDGYSPEKTFIGLTNFAQMFKDANFRLILINTLIYGVGSTAIQQVLGLGLALLLNSKIRGRNVFRAIIYLPALVAPVIMGTMYYFIFQYQQGALNTIMTGLGFEKVAWFNNPAVSVAIITIVNSIQFVGVSMIIYLAGLQTLDQSVMEAASLDGASGWKKFWNITLPMLQPAFTTSVVLNLIGGLKLFDIIKVLTNGADWPCRVGKRFVYSAYRGPGYATNSISTYISSMYFDAQNAGYASALGVFLFILIAIITYLLNTGLAKLNWEA